MYRLALCEGEAEALTDFTALYDEILGALDVEHEIMAFSAQRNWRPC